MGVKSTQTLTRKEAVEMFIDLRTKIKRQKLEAKLQELDRGVKRERWENKATIITNEDLENILERMNDEANDGEGFENYNISG